MSVFRGDIARVMRLSALASLAVAGLGRAKVSLLAQVGFAQGERDKLL